MNCGYRKEVKMFFTVAKKAQKKIIALDLLPTRLHSSVGRASHRYRRGHGFKSR